MIEVIEYCNPKVLPLKVQEAILNFKKQKIEKLKEEYKELYPEFTETEIKNVLGDIIGIEKEPIIYIETDENGNYVTEKVTIKEDDKEITYNVLGEDGNLNPDVEKIINEGKIKVKPTLDAFLKEKIEELKINEVTDSDYNLNEVEIPANATPGEKEELERLNQFRKDLKESILDKIQQVADLTYNKAKEYLANKKNLTLDQVERYKAKYEVALKAQNGDKDAKAKLKLEATLTGMTVDSLVNLIVELGSKWDEELKSYALKIDAVRVKTQKLVDNDLKKAIEVIAKGSQLSANATDDEILALFK